MIKNLTHACKDIYTHKWEERRAKNKSEREEVRKEIEAFYI